MTRLPPRSTVLTFVLTAVVVIVSSAGTEAQQIAPGFSKSFNPSTIGPGSQSALTFAIDNSDFPSPVTDLAFTDTLPAGVVIASPPVAFSTCGAGVVSAPAGGSTVTLAGGTLPSFAVCVVSVNVTSSVAGTHTNVSGDLTSSAGNSGTATADLIVDAGRPGFSKSFAPATIGLNGTSTLTFTVDNSANASLAFNLAFSDALPLGVAVADPANTANTCAGSLTAVPGTTAITFFSGLVAANGTCSISVDVAGLAAGSHGNISSPLTSNLGTSGFAGAVLDVELNALNKAFVDDPAPPGGTVTLRFTLTNFDRSQNLTGITFTDDLDATLSGLVATGLPASDVCGAGSSLTGTDLLTLAGGTLPPEGSCTFDVTLQVPAGATGGSYTNTTSTVSADLGGAPAELPAASDDLRIVAYPVLTKTFTDDPVIPGGTVTLEFTLTNTDSGSSATGITFLDDLSVGLPGVVATALPASGFCGAGSTIIGTSSFFVSNANLAAGDSCTFDVTLQIPAVYPSGTYTNTTSTVTATVGGTPVTGPAATDDLVVVAAPSLAKAFVDDPVAAGGTVTLSFTLTADAGSPGEATDITFTDDLNATLPGLVALGLPANDVCGAGSQISGTSLLTFTGGTLSPGESCSFNVTLHVPMAAAPGSYMNTTSSLSATVSGLATTSGPATDNLDVAGLLVSKIFPDSPAVAGGTVTLEFTLQNVDPSASITNIAFTDDLGTVLSGLAATGLPMSDVCGAGSQISNASTVLIFTGGSLGPSTSCTFSISLDVPAAAAAGLYTNRTATITADVDGNPTTVPPALASFEVVDPLTLAKSFVNDPVAPGSTVTLRFTVTNQHPTEALTGVSFSDDLGAALSGLAAVGLPASDVCGAGSQIAGTSVLTLTGGNLSAASSCTFDVTLQVPAALSLGSPIVNTTSNVTGLLGGVGVAGAPASDTLLIAFVSFAKAFAGPAAPGGVTTLTFSLVNLDPSSAVSNLTFVDDLNAMIPGLVATGLPLINVCGAGSQVTGTSLIAFVGGSLPAGGSCSFDVTVQVPQAASPGSFVNTTSDLSSAGLKVSDPASDTLQVEPPPSFAKVFDPGLIGAGGVSTLTFTIDNTGSTTPTTDLAFTDDLPAGVVVASLPNASTTCTGGTLTAAAGTGTVSYSGGTVAAGASCIIQADVTAADPGTYVNTSGTLTSSLGSSGTASSTLQVAPLPVLGKSFNPDVVGPGGTATLTLTIDNSGSTVPASGLDFTDNLPAGMVVATPPNASTTCTGGVLTASAGSGTMSYSGGTVAAGASCTVQADVTVADLGSYLNTTGDLASSLGVSPPASATLQAAPPPLLSKSFAPGVMGVGGVATLTLTIDNSAGPAAVTGLDVTDNLPAGMVVANPSNASTTCTGGTLTADVGSGTVSYTGGTVAAATSCTVQADVTVADAGNYVNTTGDLASSLGVTGPAAATLQAAQFGIPVLRWWGLLLLIGVLAGVGSWLLAVRR